MCLQEIYADIGMLIKGVLVVCTMNQERSRPVQDQIDITKNSLSEAYTSPL